MIGNPTVMPGRGQVIDIAAVSLGLPGFVVLAGADYGGELELLVETTEPVTGCGGCGVVATLHDRKPRWVRDLPAGGRPVRLVWFKRVWRCQEPLCSTRTWSETSPEIAPRAVLTERARAECARRVGQDATDVARVAVDLGVSWHTAMRAVRDYGSANLASRSSSRRHPRRQCLGRAAGCLNDSATRVGSVGRSGCNDPPAEPAGSGRCPAAGGP